MKKTLFIVLLLLSTLPYSVEAQTIQDVELRLDTAIQYPNDRSVNVVVEAMAFAENKPARSKIDVHVEIRYANGTVAQTSEASVEPGIRTTITFDEINEVGKYYVFAHGTVGSRQSTTESQTMRITYAPQQYTAGFLEGGRFILTPMQSNLNLTIQEYLDNGNSIVPGETYFTNGSVVDIDVPKGYLAIRYNVIDENGWQNYERSDKTGLTVHGTPYVWIYGDLKRVQPMATLVSPLNITIGILGGIMILIGCLNFFNKFREESLARRKKAGTDNMSSWRERRRDRKMREDAEADYWRRRSDPYNNRGRLW